VVFYEKLSFLSVFCGLQICQKCIDVLAAKALDPTGGADDAPPDLFVGWGGGLQSQCFRGAPDPQFSDLARSGSMPDPRILDLAGSRSRSRSGRT